MRRIYSQTILFFIVCILIISFNVYSALAQNVSAYTVFDYSKRFPGLEKLYNSSQYIKKNPSAIITDNVVYSYNAGRFIGGINPILLNPEVPPLGKYIIGLSIILFNNENIFNLVAGIICFPLLFYLSYMVLKNYMLAIIPPLLFSFEKMYLGQLITTPALDIFQLDFLLLSFIFFLFTVSRKKNVWFFIFSVLSLGCFVSTKFFASGAVVIGTYFITTILIAKENMVKLLLSLLLVPLVLIVSYSKLFILGHSLREVLGIQKWIFMYNTGHLGLPPFAVWDLILFNRWHTWWGERTITTDSQWSIIWPIILVISLLTIIILAKKSIFKKFPITLIMVWVVLYLTSLNVGQITSRYFFIFLPFLYLLTVYGLSKFFVVLLKKMPKTFLFILTTIIISFICTSSAYAQTSSYVLPYPGIMPGNKLYNLNLVVDKIQEYFAFGDFAKFQYNLSESDKYLVEAKTLFEYKQYTLALVALNKSDLYLSHAYSSLVSAKKHGKDISDKNSKLKLASSKHSEVLNSIEGSTPEFFIWEDEKKAPVKLKLNEKLEKSIDIRRKYE